MVHDPSYGWATYRIVSCRGSVAAFRSVYADHDRPFELTGVYTAVPLPDATIGPELTDDQREALMLAWERECFETPRLIDQIQLADELGISDTAMSQRLRRAIDAVLKY